MANEVEVTLASATPKLFNNGVGVITYSPAAVVTVGSAALVHLPDNSELIGVWVGLGLTNAAIIAPASYSGSLIAETTLAAAKVILTTGAGLILNTTHVIKVAVVM